MAILECSSDGDESVTAEGLLATAMAVALEMLDRRLISASFADDVLCPPSAASKAAALLILFCVAAAAAAMSDPCPIVTDVYPGRCCTSVSVPPTIANSEWPPCKDAEPPSTSDGVWGASKSEADPETDTEFECETVEVVVASEPREGEAAWWEVVKVAGCALRCSFVPFDPRRSVSVSCASDVIL